MMETKPQLGLGEYLRGEREKRHITIEQVASATKINIKLLHALECDNFDALPAKPFVRGFVTSYTRYVGLDHREVLARFEIYLDEKSGQKFRRPASAPHIFVEREGQGDNSKMWLSVAMVGSIAAAVVLFAFFKPFKHHRPHGKDRPLTNEEVVTVMPPPSDSSPISVKPVATLPTEPVMLGPAPQPKSEVENTVVAKNETKAEPKPAVKAETAADAKPEAETKPEAKPTDAPKSKPVATTPKPATPTGIATPAPVAAAVKIPPIPTSEVKYRLIIRALDDAWVKYQVDDRPLQQYTLKKDKVIFVRARTSIRFTSAKPKSLEISYDNREFKPFGNTAKTVIMPKEVVDQFKATPFVDPNPAYLSTPNQ
ncbi:MAG: helix-turn-helix domain-containing protein [Deltaproteobacteria bacterium]|nr:helix-turn-helix domain-containing protein [Deltaproteobacteria bacterium]